MFETETMKMKKIVKRRKNEFYEELFEFEKTSDGKIAYCKNCDPMKEIKMKNSNTSGLIKHLQNTHENIYKDVLKDRPIPMKPPSGKTRKRKSRSKPKPVSAIIENSEYQDLKLKTEEYVEEETRVCLINKLTKKLLYYF